MPKKKKSWQIGDYHSNELGVDRSLGFRDTQQGFSFFFCKKKRGRIVAPAL
jgi:hypothetical protein